VANPELPVPDKAGATVLDRFAVDQIADLTWRGRDCDPLGGRMYGGTLAARLLAAARAATVGPPATSGLDIHFLQPADGGLPVDYHVERAHDGRSSAVRRVTATSMAGPLRWAQFRSTPPARVGRTADGAPERSQMVCRRRDYRIGRARSGRPISTFVIMTSRRRSTASFGDCGSGRSRTCPPRSPCTSVS
jgi:hypothetical protein